MTTDPLPLGTTSVQCPRCGETLAVALVAEFERMTHGTPPTVDYRVRAIVQHECPPGVTLW
jgi:hypothetical protein